MRLSGLDHWDVLKLKFITPPRFEGLAMVEDPSWKAGALRFMRETSA